MTCDRCGAACQGARCQQCVAMAARERQPVDRETFPCPECGEATSGRGVVCYRCRGESDD